MADQAPPKLPPKLALLVCCAECGNGVDALFPVEHQALTLLLAQHGWYLPVLAPPQNPEAPFLLGALCATCAPKAFPPEVLKEAEGRRQALLAQVAPPGAAK
jgi:hypothetical protein